MKGIMFIEDLYNRTIQGHKTMTRRSGGLDVVNENPDDWKIDSSGVGLLSPKHAYEEILSAYNTPDGKYKRKFCNLVYVNFIQKDSRKVVKCKPRYLYNDIVCLKEPTLEIAGTTIYKYGSELNAKTFERWDNKMFMKSSKARNFIRINKVGIERLHDISDEDCIKEGITLVKVHHNDRKLYFNHLWKQRDGILQSVLKTPQESFFSLFKLANKVKEVPNIWCWVYSFEYLIDYKNETAEKLL